MWGPFPKTSSTKGGFSGCPSLICFFLGAWCPSTKRGFSGGPSLICVFFWRLARDLSATEAKDFLRDVCRYLQWSAGRLTSYRAFKQASTLTADAPAS